MMMTSSSYEPTLIGDEPSSVRGCCAHSEVKKIITHETFVEGWLGFKQTLRKNVQHFLWNKSVQVKITKTIAGSLQKPNFQWGVQPTRVGSVDFGQFLNCNNSLVLHPFFEDAIYDTSIVYNPTPHNIHLSGCQATVSFVGSGLGLFLFVFHSWGHPHWVDERNKRRRRRRGKKRKKKHHWGATRSAFATSMHIPVVADNNDDEVMTLCW